MITRYHRKRDDSFSSLPVELIHEIAEHLPVNDLPSFCLVCKEFHIISLRILYTNIQKPSRRCLNTLFSNVRTSQAVKTLVLPAQTNTYVGWIGVSDVPFLQEIRLEMKAALILPLLSNLQDIFVPPLSTIYAQPLSQCAFPRLRSLSYSMPITPPISLFLSRNTSIVSLTFDCYLPFRVDAEQPHNWITLHQLRYLSGNPHIIKLFAKHAPLETVHINWKFERQKTEAFDEAMSLLAKHCSSTLKEISAYRSLFRLPPGTNNIQLLVKVSAKLPHIVKFGFNNVGLNNNRTVIDSAISQFKNLEFLDMDHQPSSAVCPYRNDVIVPDYDQDEAMILAWASHDSCPVLRECRLPNGIMWSLQGTKSSLWMPLMSSVPQRKSLLLTAREWSASKRARLTPRNYQTAKRTHLVS